MQTLNTPQQLQQVLVNRRKKLKLSQSNVAARLGLSQNRYSELESSPDSLTVDRLLTLAALLGLEVQIGLKPRTESDQPLKSSKVDW